MVNAIILTDNLNAVVNSARIYLIAVYDQTTDMISMTFTVDTFVCTCQYKLDQLLYDNMSSNLK